MAYPAYLKERARELRIKNQLTLDELAERLALPKTTVWHWIKDLPLTRPRSTEGQKKGTEAMQAKYRHLREEAYQAGLDEYVDLAAQATFRDFVVLYIAEGYKRSRNTVSICNSDPRIVALGAHWMWTLSGQMPTIRVQHHIDQDADELRAFWGGVLGIEPTEIRLHPKTNSSQLRTRTWRCEHGVAAVDVHDTLFRARMAAWMDCVRSGWKRVLH